MLRYAQPDKLAEPVMLRAERGSKHLWRQKPHKVCVHPTLKSTGV